MPYQWYPGHMTKAVRMMQEDIKLIDLVIEILDARIPVSSRNPDIDKLASGKSRLVLLNKSDLADSDVNTKWKQYFEASGIECLLIDSKGAVGFRDIKNAVMKACKAKLEKDKKKGIIGRPLRAMVCGIPNVGKSTFINTYSKKACTKTGNKPGVTKGKQWIRLDKTLELLDTPGILWPKFEDEQVGLHLAMTGSINDEIILSDELACDIIEFMKKDYPGVLNGRYNICEDKDKYEILSDVAVVRGCMLKGAEPDLVKAAGMLIDDFRSGRLGKISLEKP